MRQVEVACLGLECITWVTIDKIDNEQCVIVPAMVVDRPGSELLVGRHVRTRNVMCEEERVGRDVTELDDIVVANDSTTTSRRQRLRW